MSTCHVWCTRNREVYVLMNQEVYVGFSFFFNSAVCVCCHARASR
jgi:hypothetical protein